MEFESNLKLFDSEVKEIEWIRQLAENLSVLLSRGERLHIKWVNVSDCIFEISRDCRLVREYMKLESFFSIAVGLLKCIFWGLREAPELKRCSQLTVHLYCSQIIVVHAQESSEVFGSLRENKETIGRRLGGHGNTRFALILRRVVELVCWWTFLVYS